MKLTRRAVLGGTAAALSLPAVGLRAAMAQDDGMAELRAVKALHQLAPAEYPATEIWGYDGAAPGPEIRLGQGERLRRRLVNALDQPSTIHWHGIRIDNAMDGVPELTQEAVAPGDSFDYDFVLPDAGTYWYHAHNQSPEQVGRGLYGPLIVEESAPPELDAEHVLILDDWRLDDQAQIDPDFASGHDLSHGGRMGNFIATNAQFDLALPVQQNQRLRLRLINAANARIFPLGLKGLEGWIMAYDGMPLPAPVPVTSEMVLAPAQRIDLIVDVTAAEGDEAYLVRFDRDAAVAQVSFPVTGRGALGRRPAPGALPPNPVTALGDLDAARRVEMRIEGGAMGGVSSATLDGEKVSFRQMIAQNQFWAMAGSAGMPENPLVAASLGETVRINMINDTMFPHAMHLHGMHFRDIGPDGALGPLRDTFLLQGRETREIAFVADNPGEWLFHCHMLGHAATGMMQRVRVA